MLRGLKSISKTRAVQLAISLYLLFVMLSLPFYPVLPYSRVAAPIMCLALISIIAALSDRVGALERAMLDLLKDQAEQRSRDTHKVPPRG